MRTLPFALAPGVALPLLGQAPVITPQGDPSVRADAIYRLAGDTGGEADQPVV